MVDPELRKELAREALDLLQNRIFLQAVADLRKTWFAELMVSGGQTDTPERRQELVAKLRALEEIPLKLNGYVSDERYAKKGR
jgi:hypothetical protein